jgi:hypothetical protein
MMEHSWATSGGSLNTARYGLAGCGTQTAALGFWWFCWLHQLIQMQQKNMMVLLGQQLLEV